MILTSTADPKLTTEFLSQKEIAEGKDPRDYGNFDPETGILQAFKQNIGGTYLKTPDVSLTRGFTFSTTVTRTSGVSGMTEVELGKDNFGPLVHLEWNEGSLWYCVAKGGDLDCVHAVHLGIPSPTLVINFKGNEKLIEVDVFGKGEHLLHEEYVPDWSVYGPHKDGMHINWVATAGSTTTRDVPVRLEIHDLYLHSYETVSWWKRLWQRISSFFRR